VARQSIPSVYPQVYTCPWRLLAMLWFKPQAMSSMKTRWRVPSTWVGFGTLVLLRGIESAGPSPSCPKSDLPQANSIPSLDKARQ
jgi:hypothetical protein